MLTVLICRSYGTYIRNPEIIIRSLIFLTSLAAKNVWISLNCIIQKECYDNLIRCKLYLFHRFRRLMVEEGTLHNGVDSPSSM